MKLTSIIAKLKTEQEGISRAIAALLGSAGVARRGRPPKAAVKAKRRGMSAEARRRISLAMKRRWAQRKAKSA